MRPPFEAGFRVWFEVAAAKDAIVGVVSGGQDVAGREEEHLLGRKTTDFSSSVRGRLKNLGVVKSVLGKGARVMINRAIDDGVTVSDLVRMVASRSLKEDRYESEADGMARFADVSAEMAGQHPDYTKTPDKLAAHLLSKGFSADEAKKAADARFGPAQTDKRLIIMRGVSGSGKSTVARRIAEETGGVVYSTDDFFEKDGEYRFDPKMLPRHHADNQRRAEEAMMAGRSPIIIDNTNTEAWEMRPYVVAAMKNGYKVEIMEPGSPGFPEVDLDEIMKRQQSRKGGKSMPESVVRRMASRFQKGLSVEEILASKSPFRP